MVNAMPDASAKSPALAAKSPSLVFPFADITPAPPAEPSSPVYFPLINLSTIIAEIELSSISVGDGGGSKTSFLPGSTIQYVASGFNHSNYAGIVLLTWTLTSACDTTVIFRQELTLQPGVWEHTLISTVPDCLGITIVTVDVLSGSQLLSLSTLFVAFPSSVVVVDNRQAFDICTLPTTEQMQTWWNGSPYDVFNIYLGGIAFACDENPLNPYWLDAVYRQGWRFILTWVGPQAPCTTFFHRMSANAATAYQQGRAEADLAADAAAQLGFLGGKIIYYDLEAYRDATSECRNAVDEFMRGWTVRLHELGAKTGAYGSPLYSYISDWADNNPPLDDVWIAHWIYSSYNPNATVWTPYLDNSLWSSHQRLRQYAGGHSETWGGLSMTIDSNVLDGEVTAMPGAFQALDQASIDLPEIAQPPLIGDMELLSTGAGWVLLGDRLLWSEDGGRNWQEITPPADIPEKLLAVEFLDAQQGWLVRHGVGQFDLGNLEIMKTDDGGKSWQSLSLPASPSEGWPLVANAFLEFVDTNTGWLALKLQSGSSFSLGRLYFTQDGGSTWQERRLPLGEPVVFLDAAHGWVSGGPTGGELYTTEDGGLTWQEVSLPGLESVAAGRVLVGLPQFSSPGTGFLPATRTNDTGSDLILYETRDGGKSWQETFSHSLEPGIHPGSALPFSLEPGGNWWAISPGEGRLYTASESMPSIAPLAAADLPPGVIALDFNAEGSGWALAQEGICAGEKSSSMNSFLLGSQPFLCAQHTRLLATSDGGITWSEVTP